MIGVASTLAATGVGLLIWAFSETPRPAWHPEAEIILFSLAILLFAISGVVAFRARDKGGPPRVQVTESRVAGDVVGRDKVSHYYHPPQNGRPSQSAGQHVDVGSFDEPVRTISVTRDENNHWRGHTNLRELCDEIVNWFGRSGLEATVDSYGDLWWLADNFGHKVDKSLAMFRGVPPSVASELRLVHSADAMEAPGAQPTESAAQGILVELSPNVSYVGSDDRNGCVVLDATVTNAQQTAASALLALVVEFPGRTLSFTADSEPPALWKMMLNLGIGRQATYLGNPVNIEPETGRSGYLFCYVNARVLRVQYPEFCDLGPSEKIACRLEAVDKISGATAVSETFMAHACNILPEPVRIVKAGEDGAKQPARDTEAVPSQEDDA